MTQFAFNSRIFSGGDSSSCPLLTSRFGSVSLLEKFMLKRAKNKPKCAQNLSKWAKICPKLGKSVQIYQNEQKISQNFPKLYQNALRLHPNKP